MRERSTGNDLAHTSLTPPPAHCDKHLSNLINANIDKMVLAMDVGDGAAVDKFFNKASRLYDWACNNYTPEAIENGPVPVVAGKGKIMENNERLSRLQEDLKHLDTARGFLRRRESCALKKMEELEKKQPELMARVALGEEPEESLDAVNTEMFHQVTITQEPTRDAIQLLETQMNNIHTEMANVRATMTAAQDREKYNSKQDAIAARGEYTAADIDELEHLAMVSGMGREFRHFKQVLDDYIFRRETSGNRAEFPVFEFTE